jgi:hypothetical protein
MARGLDIPIKQQDSQIGTFIKCFNIRLVKISNYPVNEPFTFQGFQKLGRIKAKTV